MNIIPRKRAIFFCKFKKFLFNRWLALFDKKVLLLGKLLIIISWCQGWQAPLLRNPLIIIGLTGALLRNSLIILGLTGVDFFLWCMPQGGGQKPCVSTLFYKNKSKIWSTDLAFDFKAGVNLVNADINRVRQLGDFRKWIQCSRSHSGRNSILQNCDRGATSPWSSKSSLSQESLRRIEKPLELWSISTVQ